jgi:CRISPR-associated protein Cas2
MKYLIAYDIAEPRRLRRVARYLEQHALRCQKSVFLANVTRREVVQIMDGVAQLISPTEDVVQAWKLSFDQPPGGLVRGIAASLYPSCVVHAEGRSLFVEEEEP